MAEIILRPSSYANLTHLLSQMLLGKAAKEATQKEINVLQHLRRSG